MSRRESLEKERQEREARKQKRSRKLMILGIVLGVVLVITLIVFFVRRSQQKKADAEIVYREQAVEYGELTVGITEEGTITIGTSVQQLDIDISAFTGTGSTFGGGQMGGAGGMGGGMDMMAMGGTSSSSSSSETRELEIQEVYVSVGQQIAMGDPIARLNEESVASIRASLEEDVVDAQNAYDQAVTERTVNDNTADQNYQIYNMYGSYAQTSYDSTQYDLQEAVNDAEAALVEAQTTLQDLQDELSEAQTNLASYKTALENAEYVLSTSNQESNLYEWIMSEYARENAQTLVDNTETSVDTLTDQVKSQQRTVEQAQQAVTTAKKAYETGMAGAQQEYDSDMVYFNNASEYQTVYKEQNELSVEIAQCDLEEAQEKLDEFNATIQNNELLSEYDGSVSNVYITVGDDLYTGSQLMEVNDYDDVTVTVDVDEDDITNATLGAQARVSVPALSGYVFDAVVTEVGDATYDSSSGSTYYEVTVQLEGDMDELYADMTAEVTFITRDTDTVLYIPNRAVTRENGESTVKVRTSNGGIETRKITTGFSDGTNVEVADGLEEGEIVLIESKVETR